MKAKELMIGDWVMPLKKKLKGIPGKVITIDGGTNVCWIDSKDYSCLVPCSDVERIPLTPEILEKNGFKRIEGNRFYPNPRWVFAKDGSRDGVVIEIVLYEQPINGVNILTKINTQSSKDYGVNDIHNCDIEYVHQLQQALRLCKIDKEIVVC